MTFYLVGVLVSLAILKYLGFWNPDAVNKLYKDEEETLSDFLCVWFVLLLGIGSWTTVIMLVLYTWEQDRKAA